MKCITNIDLSVPKGTLVGICGNVGAGKTSLLYTILGLTEVVSGTVAVAPRVAYVSQQAWIQSDTLRNNILFGEVAIIASCLS